jgi:hypothetical protein
MVETELWVVNRGLDDLDIYLTLNDKLFLSGFCHSSEILNLVWVRMWTDVESRTLSKWYKNSDADVAWREWLARFPWGPVTWQRIRSADPSLPFGWWRASP